MNSVLTLLARMEVDQTGFHASFDLKPPASPETTVEVESDPGDDHS